MWREPGVLLVLFIVIVGLGVLPLRSWLRERRRRQAMQRLAGELGLRYRRSATSVPLRGRSSFLTLTRERPFASNALSGTFQGHGVWVLDYYPSGRPVWGYEGSESSPARTVVLLEHDGSFPELGICPTPWGLKLSMLREDVIEFESAEFAKAYFVQSRDREFAYDVCHPRMMELLLLYRDLCLEFCGDSIILYAEGRLPAEQIPRRLQQLVEIRNLLPAYLFEKHPKGR